MLKIFLFIYISILLLFFTGYDLIFVNEEFLVAFCLIIFFSCLYSFLRKSIAKIFFIKIDFIYFSFLYLINLNILLINNIKNLLKLFTVRFNFIVLDFYSNFFDIISLGLLNLKNIVLANLLNTFVFNLYNNSRSKINFYKNLIKLNNNFKMIVYNNNVTKLIFKSKIWKYI